MFEALDNVALMHHFLYRPEDEAAEQTLIKEQICKSPQAAYCIMVEWFRAEMSQGFPGYDLKCKPVRVRDLAGVL